MHATGSNEPMSKAVGYLAPPGRLVYVGITTRESTLKHPPLHKVEGTIMGSRNPLAPDFTRIIKLIEDGQIDTRPWITHRADFDGLIAAFPNWLKPESGVVKAMVSLDD